MITIICQHCKITFITHPHKNAKFCGRSCAASFNNKSTKLKHGKYLPNNQNSTGRVRAQNGRFYDYTVIKRKQCTICAKEFWSRRDKGRSNYRNVCSEGCYINSKIKSSHSVKRNTYRGFKFQSSWEVEIAKFLDQHEVTWIQPAPITYWLDKPRKYYADFFLPKYNTYLDPKNPYAMLTQAAKLEIVQQQIFLVCGDVDYIKSSVLNLLESNQ